MGEMGSASARARRRLHVPRWTGRLGSFGTAAALCLLLLPTPEVMASAPVSRAAVDGRGDLDRRTATVQPTAAQRQAVHALGARATWNAFGTPHSLINDGGFLSGSIAGNTAAVAARSWVAGHAGLFRLGSVSNQDLELINDSRLVDSNGHAVLFRQRFGSLPAVQDGMLTLGVVGTPSAGWRVAYVSSTIAGSQQAPGGATISPRQAWLTAAHNAGLNGRLSAISKVRKDGDWTTFAVKGYAQLQRARLRALPIPGQGVRTVYEVDVVDVAGATTKAYVSLVDARDRTVWFRQNRVDELGPSDLAPQKSSLAAAPVTGTFSGNTANGGGCGPKATISVAAGTKSIDVVASATNPANDIVLKLLNPANTTVASSDEATSPEAIHYAPSSGVPAGNYHAQVCPFDGSAAAFPYSGFWITQDTAGGPGVPYPPEWKFFEGNPRLTYSSADSRIVACWQKAASVADCDVAVKNSASRAPWDFLVQSNTPSFSSIGNNAKTAEAWLSPLTPGENYSPPQPDRSYEYAWTNQWYTSKCNPASFSAAGNRNDIDASIINLFVGHNRMHDFSYNLGFTEQNYNAQLTNFGNTPPGPYPGGREADPELGNVQAGAVTGGNPSFEGRDNANQITLQDGVPPITNQYLFQPVAGAFYAPCTDGSFDFSVFGHEYTHLISNRMVGGPDSSLTGDQAGAMGESWSDLDALEYMREHDIHYGNGANDWALGPYVTGNKSVGIRNFALNNSPLNYSDIGYDSACNGGLVGPPVDPACPSRTEVHADGEVWNAVNYDIRQALVNKYNASYSASNTALQLQCANGNLPAGHCPGNRRWIQLVYDAWLLMPPDVDMLGARDAMLAADMMRFGGANQVVMWHAFAARGFGSNASTAGTDDADPVGGWRSPREATPQLRFTTRDEHGNPVANAKIYVGRFEAGVTPAADTAPATPLSDTMPIVKGTYAFIATAPGYGAVRFNWTVTSQAKQHVTIHFMTNWASKTKGATANGAGGNFNDLIDDTESTDWSLIGAAPNVVGKSVTVKLGGGAHVVDRVAVSAMLRPGDSSNTYDPNGQNRFTALRSFNIQTCNAHANNCALPTSWTTVGHFINAFKAVLPRPLMPNMLIKSFDVTNTTATQVRLVVLDNQCTGNPHYAGEQDNDPVNNTDCQSASARDQDTHVAELQVFSGKATATATNDPVVLLTAVPSAATAARGSAVTLDLGWRNAGPAAASGAVLSVTLPSGTGFVSATGGGTWSSADRTVTWKLGNVANGATGTRSLVIRVTKDAAVGDQLVSEAQFYAPKTVAAPAWAVVAVK